MIEIINLNGLITKCEIPNITRVNWGGGVMASAYERQALLHQISVTSSPKGAPILTLSDVFAHIQELWKAGQAITRLEELEAEDVDADVLEAAKRRAANAIFIQDMKVTEKYATLLITVGDAAEADPSLVDLNSRDLRRVRKKLNEGVAFSAHLVVALDGSKKPIQHRAVLERMPLLGRSVIITYLNRLLRRKASSNAHFRFTDTDGKDRAWRPKLVANTQPSRTLHRALKEGQLSEVTLVQRTALDSEIDSGAGFKVDEKRLKVSSNLPLTTAAHRKSWLNSLKAWAKGEGYTEIQVRMKSFTGGSDYSTRLATDLNDAADAIYSRHEEFSFDSAVNQAHNEIESLISDQLRRLIGKDEVWS